MVQVTSGKRPYEAPKLTVIGSFEEVTQGTNVGLQLDAAIPNNTPISQIPGFIQNHVS